MRRIGIFLGVVSMLLLALPVAAQDEPGTLAQEYFMKVKPSKAQAFEEAFTAHTEWHRNNDPRHWDTWQIINGENLGSYVVRSPGHRWEDFDIDPELGTADDEHFLTHVALHGASISSRIVNVIPEVTNWPYAETEHPALVTVLEFKLRYNKASDFAYAVRKVSKAIRESNYPSRGAAWLTVVNGGEQPTFILVQPRKNWADMKGPDKPLWTMLEEVYGRKGADNLRKLVSKVVVSLTSSIAQYRPDLSSVPTGQ